MPWRADLFVEPERLPQQRVAFSRVAEYAGELGAPLTERGGEQFRTGALDHSVKEGRFAIGPFTVHVELVCHPGPTVGYRIEADGASIAYLPDHEPVLGLDAFPDDPDDIPGLGFAAGVDLLIHDAMYTVEEYPRRVGWGHSSHADAMAFAAAARVKRLVPFHHDPSHGDEALDRLFADATASPLPFELLRGEEGACYELRAR